MARNIHIMHVLLTLMFNLIITISTGFLNLLCYFINKVCIYYITISGLGV